MFECACASLCACAPPSVYVHVQVGVCVRVPVSHTHFPFRLCRCLPLSLPPSFSSRALFPFRSLAHTLSLPSSLTPSLHPSLPPPALTFSHPPSFALPFVLGFLLLLPSHVLSLFRQLQELYLSYNNISVLPPALHVLHDLRSLHADHNQLFIVEPWIGSLTSLTVKSAAAH